MSSPPDRGSMVPAWIPAPTSWNPDSIVAFAGMTKAIFGIALAKIVLINRNYKLTVGWFTRYVRGLNRNCQ